ncbi:phage scaffolding protein [Secundilactobacillus kimchicus]|nr:phage scaffolding protein [Secundilactobacillus kimchicus]
MKRELLKGLGLTEEQMDKIMAANGADIEKAKSGLGDVEALKTENASLKEQLTGRDKDLKSLQKQAGNSEELTKQLEDLQNQYKTDTEALQGQLHQTKLNGALDTVLSGAKVRNTKAAKALLDMDKIELTDNGDLKGVDDQLSA